MHLASQGWHEVTLTWFCYVRYGAQGSEIIFRGFLAFVCILSMIALYRSWSVGWDPLPTSLVSAIRTVPARLKIDQVCYALSFVCGILAGASATFVGVISQRLLDSQWSLPESSVEGNGERNGGGNEERTSIGPRALILTCA